MEEYHGLVLVDKPSGWTSHDLVNWGRKIFKTRSVGHCGTLDPIASGLMILLIGEATKLSNYILERDKSYRVGIQIGIETDSFDITGKEVARSTKIPDGELIRSMALVLQGDFHFPVPIYSAVKINGTRLHEYARRGEHIETPSKLMRFWDLKVLSQAEDSLEIDISCSKGSFIRSWVQEFGQKLGTGAAMKSLIRTSSLPYFLNQSKTTGEIENLAIEQKLLEALIPIDQALPEAQRVIVQQQDQVMLMNGQISNGLKTQLISIVNPQESTLIKAVAQGSGKMMALIAYTQGQGFQIKRGFRY